MGPQSGTHQDIIAVMDIQMDGWTDGQTDGRSDYHMAPLRGHN